MIALQKQISITYAGALRLCPGLAVCAALGAAATGLAMWGGSGVVWALLIGVAIATAWSPPSAYSAGIEAAAKPILRFGVALLGTQISAATLTTLDMPTIALLACSIAVVLIAGVLLARVLGLDRDVALIAAGSVAICGASAAVAFGLVLSHTETRERDVACTVGAVSILSMLAMLIYPMLAKVLGFDTFATGIFLGGTIQEVPHAVAAGYALDPVAGQVATVTKLLRVALLGPTLLLVTTIITQGAGSKSAMAFRPPGFLAGFVLLAALNVAGLMPAFVGQLALPLSRFCLVMAMAAIGLKLQWRSVTHYGWRPLLLLVTLSGLLVALVALFVVQAQV